MGTGVDGAAWHWEFSWRMKAVFFSRFGGADDTGGLCEHPLKTRPFSGLVCCEFTWE